ncbi:DUF222 domain-containing protein [Microbacterium aurum]
MDLLTAPLDDLLGQASQLVRDAAAGRVLERATEHELARQVSAIGDLARLTEALLVDAVGEITRRSEHGCRDDFMTSHLGCRNVTELVENLTRMDARTASRLQRAAKAVRPEVSGTTGEVLDAAFPRVRSAMLDGVVGVDGVLAITEPLQASSPRIAPSARRHAEEIVVAEARGEGPHGAPPASAGILRVHAQAWALALDADGAEPRERAALRARGLTLGTATPTGVPIRGTLLPEVAAQLQTIFDAHLAPKVTFDNPEAEAAYEDGSPVLTAEDTRTRAQKQHDVLAAALNVAASSGLLPTIGGHAPTLVVSVTADDLESGRGYAHVQGCEQPVTVSLARHVACAGTIQRVTSRDDRRIIRIDVRDRVFNRYQRRAIALRDGGCVIPGCGVPASWCEIHHVTEHAGGGPTHTDNGVPLSAKRISVEISQFAHEFTGLAPAARGGRAADSLMRGGW